MKTLNRIFLYSVIFFLIVIIAGCSKIENYGKAVSEADATEISDILSNPKNYEGKTVKVEGKIITECPTGCWFDLKDETGAIYIDINDSGFAIPQKTGHRAIAEGKVKTKNGKVQIMGKGVEIK